MRTKLILATLVMSAATFAQAQVAGQLSNVTRLTNDVGTKYENPRFSPDGQQIAFTKFGYEGIQVMKVDGTARKTLSRDLGVGYGYQWSADGNEILVRDSRIETAPNGKPFVHGIFTIDMDGKKTRLSKDAGDMWPAAWRYTANGTAIAVFDGKKVNTNRKLKALSGQNANAGIPRKLKTELAKPAYRISFISDCEYLWAVDANGAKKAIYTGVALCPALSLDGKQVAFVNEIDEICVMSVDGTGLKKVGKGFNPQWVNGNQLIYERTTDDGHNYLTGELYLLNIGTKAEKKLTNTSGRIEMNPSISADGKKLVFTDHTDGQVYVADLK